MQKTLAHVRSYGWVLFLALAGMWPTRSTAFQGRQASEEGLPLPTPRSVRFVTDEGTWMSLDVSPDGRTIVFELLGDLYTLPIGGGKATRIIAGPAFESQPRYSPDGHTIVFVSDRSGYDNVWLADADGANPRPLTSTRDGLYISPVWTPDGSSIIVSRRVNNAGDATLLLFHRDGGSGLEINRHPAPSPGVRGFADIGAAFGSDPHKLFFSTRTSGFGNLGQQAFQVESLDLDTGRVSRLTSLQGSAMRPVISPDGAWLVYATREDGRTNLRLRELATGNERGLARDVQRDECGTLFTRDVMPGSAFTPDGHELVTTIGGKLWRVAVPSGERRQILFSADVDLSLGELTHFSYRIESGDFTARQIRDPKLSPDKMHLAFSAAGRIWIMDFPAGVPRRVTRLQESADPPPNERAGEHSPAWSPDGKYIAYVTWSDLDGGSVYRMAVDHPGESERLSRDSAFYRDLAYTRDGSRLVAIRGPMAARASMLNENERGVQGEHQLVWLPAAGGNPTTIAPVTNRAGGPHFGPDPNCILFYQPGEGVVSIGFDGGNRRVLARITGARTAQDVVVSPDGQRAVATFDGDVFLIALPATPIQPPPQIVVGLTESTLPVTRITRVGGEFPVWSADGGTLSFALGRSFFSVRVDNWPSKPLPAGLEEVEVKPTIPSDRPHGTVVLRGGRILTMRHYAASAGFEIIPRGDVVVQGDRIAAVGPTGEVRLPLDAAIIDVSGKTILPGWIDIHSHIRPGDGIQRSQVWEYLAQLAYGVTTIRDPQSSTSDIFAYADLVDSGAVLGPRVYSTGPGVFRALRVSSLADAREVLTRYSSYYRTGTLKQYLAGDRRVRQWIVMAARELHLTPTTEGNFDFKQNLTDVLDGYAGREHSFPNFPLYKDVVQLVAKSGLTYTPTLIINYAGPPAENYLYLRDNVHNDPKMRRFLPHEELDRRTWRQREWYPEGEYVFKQQAADVARIVAAGGRAGLGGHGQLQGLGVDWELWLLASGGMPLQDVLRVGTIWGAEAIGLDRDLGSIETGKLADLQVLDQDPLASIDNVSSIRYVMKGGRLFDALTLDEIWPVPRALGRQWWWETPDAQSKRQ